MADPGFSRGGCANSQIGIILSIFCRKLHENERIWTPGGRASLAPPLDQPMSSIFKVEPPISRTSFSVVLLSVCCHPIFKLWKMLNIGSIRIYILTTGVVSNETNTYVRMYIEEFILVDLDTLLHKVEVLNE